MKNENKYYLGADVSKLWFDVSMMMVAESGKKLLPTERFDNTPAGLKAFGNWMKSHKVSLNGNSLLVIENTGVYHRLLWEYCSVNNLPIHIGNAAGIKWSLGITRGKNDVTDSQRLCNYCYKHAEDLKATPVLDPVFLKIRDLISSRCRLLSQLNATKVYLEELKASNTKEVQTIMNKAHKAALDGLKSSIKEIEAQIHKTIKEKEAVRKNYDLLLTVPGIGHVTAAYLICCTNNFLNKVSGKQLASYAGVVPFENTSGTSIKGRKRVHKMANKELKKLLHMAALSAINNYPEFGDYYKRKKAENKHGLSILNAVKNKIILRAAAVIIKQQEYVNNYQNAA